MSRKGVDVGERLRGRRQFDRAEARERLPEHLAHVRVPRVACDDARRQLAPAVHGAAQRDSLERRAEPGKRRRHVRGAKRDFFFSEGRRKRVSHRRVSGRVRTIIRRVVSHDAVLDERQDALVVAAPHEQVVQRALLPRGSVRRPCATGGLLLAVAFPRAPPRRRGVRRRRGAVRPREGYRPRASQQREQSVSTRRHRRRERAPAAPRGVRRRRGDYKHLSELSGSAGHDKFYCEDWACHLA